MTKDIGHRPTAGRARPLAVLAVAALLAVPGAARAQAAPVAPLAPPADTITLEEAVSIALRQNAALRLAENVTELNETTVRQRTMALLPDLQASTRSSQSFGATDRVVNGRVISSDARVVSADLSSSLTLFDGGSNLNSLREARLSRDATEREVARARQTVAFEVLSNYLTLIAGREQLRVREEALAAQEAEERRIAEYVEAGARTIADLYQQQAQVASARVAVVEARRAVELAKVDLMQTLQLDPRGSYEFAVPPVGPIDTVATYGLDSLLDRAFAQRLDLAAQRTLVDAAEAGVRAARGAYLPTVSVSAGYGSDFQSTQDGGIRSQFNENKGGSVGIGVSIPLFDRQSASIATERAQIQEESARIALESQRQAVGLQVRQAYLDVLAAIEQFRAAEAQLRAADLALRTTQERYEVGAATLFELAQARAQQVQAASGLVNARYNLLFQDQLIAYYVGDLDPERIALD